MSGNLSLARSKANGDYASVVEQSGIRAGDGGFDLDVQGNTDLKGAVIASTQAAIDASASARSSGIDLSSDMLIQGKYGLSKAVIGTALNNGDARESDNGRTLAAVSAGTLEIVTNRGSSTRPGRAAKRPSPPSTVTLRVATMVSSASIPRSWKRKQAEAERIIKNAVAVEAFKFSDDAYRTMFVKEHPMYEVMLNEDGSVKLENDKPVLRLLSDEEKLALKAGPDGRIRIGVNGIFNDEKVPIHKYQYDHPQREARYATSICRPILRHQPDSLRQYSSLPTCTGLLSALGKARRLPTRGEESPAGVRHGQPQLTGTTTTGSAHTRTISSSRELHAGSRLQGPPAEPSYVRSTTSSGYLPTRCGSHLAKRRAAPG
ncbi:hypothetical protein [Halotalea alkalilenta]|uniref:hypothetical protein n=1 Tax=Halotalea alkalilenta TaxID=376489 RepID=UPI0012DCE028|nr:hypothetical protein [Halotalea alkalilenta]